ncbi:MAG: FMN-binding glutamate synthase family protein [Pseudomonadota bacterium]
MTLMQKWFWFIALGVNPALAVISYLYWPLGFWIVALLSIYTVVGLHDLFVSRHTLNRLYPVAAYIRYALESIRPEIHQYFIASDTDELPFSREDRNLVYRRAQNLDDTMPFGTEHDIMEPGYGGAPHSIAPTTVREETKRVMIGGDQCKQPYSAARLNCSAMSFGALGANAVRAINRGAKVAGFYHNTGEGGLSPHHLLEGGDIVWQIGTGYFGCRTKDGDFHPEEFQKRAAHDHVKMIEIKISQGAKPSHGGVLPAAKVTQEIADIRLVEIGKDVISPPAHRTFETPKGLLDFVVQLRELSGGKPVGFKLCIGHRYEFMAICKAMVETGILPDFITVDGAEGGTGAAPVEYSNRFGVPCIEATHFVHNCLRGIGLRDKIRVISSGKTASGYELVRKIAVGADLVNAARTMMLSLGCIQSQSCNTNKCPTGIATQDPVRSRALDIDTRHLRVANFQRNTLKVFFDMVGAMGLDDPDKLVPHFIWYRGTNEAKFHFDEIYPSLERNALLDGKAEGDFAREWALASAESFAPNVTETRAGAPV